MKRKNRVRILLDPDQRIALWCSVDLLRFLSSAISPKIDLAAIDSVCDSLEAVDGDPNVYEFELTPTHHRVCSYAIKYALLYLNGERRHFDFPIPKHIDSELSEFSEIIQVLTSAFPV